MNSAPSKIFGERDIGIVILNYENPADTVECVRALVSAGALHTCQIVVIDNGSRKSSVVELVVGLRAVGPALHIYDSLEHWPVTNSMGIELYLNSINEGYGPGNNIGIRRLRDAKVQWIWILNNDTTIDRENFTRLCTALSKMGREAVILGVRVHTPGSPSGADTLGGGTLIRWAGRTRPARADSRRRARPLSYISGASMIVEKTVFDLCGLLVEDHFLFWEEQDFARRAEAKGAVLRVLEDVIVDHKQGVVSGARPSSTTPQAAFYASRAAIIYYRRHESRAALTCAIIARVAHAMMQLRTGGAALAWATVRGIAAGVRTH